MDASDFFEIVKSSFGSILADDVIQRMVNVNSSIINLMVEDSEFLRMGSPFEFNLRDLLRWAQITVEVSFLIEVLLLKIVLFEFRWFNRKFFAKKVKDNAYRIYMILQLNR